MAHAIRMPKPGQMTEECVLTSWLKAEGDPVHRGDVLFEIETDKSSMEVEAFDEGVLLRRVVPEGATVPVNAVCGWVGAPGEQVPDADEAVGTVTNVAAPVTSTGGAGTDRPAPAAVAAPGEAMAPAAGAPVVVASGRFPAPEGRVRISPRATRLAADAGIDPRTLTGTGPDGRIVERDVRAAMEAAAAGGVPAVARAAAAAGVPAGVAKEIPAFVIPPVDGEEEPRPLTRMRRVIADRLTASYRTTPHFTVTVSADVTRLMAYRADLKAAGTDLTVTDFVLAAAAQALAEFPDVNSRTDGVSVFPRRRVHLGVAVALPAGLVVPVIRDADRLTVSEIHGRAAALGAAARDGKLTVDEMTGSTFTVSNLGMYGVDEFSAIINPGEAAILAVASALRQPVAIGEAIAVRWIMRLTLSADHRLVDGEMAARFLNALRRRLEDARSLRLD
jgi:pyruvate dehydrogenase E2 component (dihydrolipoamide acetyltransferase)